MLRFIAKRAAYALISLAILSFTIFLLMRVSGDPAALLAAPNATNEEIAEVRTRLGLDQPLVVQYLTYVGNLARGDFGQSFQYGAPVLELYLSRLPSSLYLAAVALAFSLLVGVPVGVLSAVKSGGLWDRFARIFAMLGLALPSFWLGLIFILVFSVYLRWLPSSGSGSPLHIILPAVTLGWYFTAAHMRLTRSSMLDVMGSEYIKLARLKGLPEWLVIGKHALRNALIPLVTLAGINLVQMVNASVVVEAIFAWPGIGRLLFEGISQRDFPVVQGVVVLGGVMIVTVNLLVDILYAVIDPRIKLEAQAV
ncbi:ABC transporter permease [Ramlibacter sp.]|uniref:ABC transporter permease n=1 Tax=Ramlibacter sp. TaxID=1917967 RepID=UPI003D10627A